MVAEIFYKAYGLICGLCIKEILLLFQSVYNDFINGLYPLSRRNLAAVYFRVVLIDIVPVRRSRVTRPAGLVTCLPFVLQLVLNLSAA